jgi:pimeloyl-ACP methyl ester carboxylesterase
LINTLNANKKYLTMKKFIIYSALLIAVMCSLKAQNTLTTSIVDYDTLKKEKAIQIKGSTAVLVPSGAAQAAAAPGGGNPTSQTPVRAIYWIHGLGGNTGSWSPVKKATDAPLAINQGYAPRNVINVIPECVGCYNCVGCATANLSYGQDVDMANATEDLRDAIEAKYTANVAGQVSVPNNNFIISHSQGGIVSRALDYTLDQYNLLYPGQYPKRYNGIVTFGTPHQGAGIVNNTNAMQQYATVGVQRLLNGYVKKWKAQNPFVTVVSGSAIDSTFAKVVKNVLEFAFPIVFKTTTAPLAQSYKSGSLFLKDTLNPHTLASTYHKATFYGVEDEPVLFKQMHSFIETPPQNEVAFSASYDDSIYNKWIDQVDKHTIELMHAENRRNFFQNQEDVAQITCYASFLLTATCPPCVVASCAVYAGAQTNRINWTSAKNAFQDGIDFLNGMNDSYKGFIGSYEWKLDTTYIYECTKKYQEQGEPVGPNQTQTWFWVYDPFFFGPYTSPAQCASQGPIDAAGTCNVTAGAYAPSCKLVLTWKYIENQSDGVVLAKSAANFPGDVYEKQVMMGANHQQLRNHPTTKIALLDLFNGKKDLLGNARLNPWFKTPIK